MSLLAKVWTASRYKPRSLKIIDSYPMRASHSSTMMRATFLRFPRGSNAAGSTAFKLKPWSKPMHVRKLKRALPDGARVASVDKFQGQEAPIVIVSMCASPGEFGSRGMQFVLDKNRLNVAISRAQSLASVIALTEISYINSVRIPIN